MLSVIYMHYEKVYALSVPGEVGNGVGKACDEFGVCKEAKEKLAEGIGHILGEEGKEGVRHSLFWCDDHDCGKGSSGK